MVIERFFLLVTDKSTLQTNYLRKVPIEKIHLMTLFRQGGYKNNFTIDRLFYVKEQQILNTSFPIVLQLIPLILTGFHLGSYVKLSFPFIVLLMIPLRHYVLPKFINKTADGIPNDAVQSYIDILDGAH